MRRVIFGADDFGSCKAVNQAIEESFRDGILTSCSLMATGLAFTEAVEIIWRNPALAVGVHLVLCQGHSLLPQKFIPNLVGHDGKFRQNPIKAGMAYALIPGIQYQLEAEMREQIERVLATGVLISHLDSHLHIHVHPVIFKLMMKLGEEYGIKRIRIPSEPIRVGNRFNLAGASEAFELQIISERLKRLLNARKFAYNHYLFGIRHSGSMKEKYVIGLLRNLPGGIGEIYFHPAKLEHGAEPLEPKGPNEVDYHTLMSPAIRKLLAELEIGKTSYLGLEKS